ncbi:MAG: hypothetical protein JW951_09080 [Lentisphaerae bacterium]|nr:hypothetical protein [Lentisphaerota bacterium]
MKTLRYALTALALGVTFAGPRAPAQEPAFMDAATHPGANQLYLRLLLSHAEYGEAGRTDVDQQTALLKLAYGFRSELALLLDADVRRVDTGAGDETGLGLITTRLKYRFLKRDLGPLNTWRASLLGGLSLPGSIDTAVPDEAFPRLGAVTTAILGRHGLNAACEWLGYRDGPDTVSFNASHLYRLAPARYAADTRGAWYTMAESLNNFTDDGDRSLDLALGLLYEARRWAAELSLRLPLEEDGPLETDHEAVAGWRYLF